MYSDISFIELWINYYRIELRINLIHSCNSSYLTQFFSGKLTFYGKVLRASSTCCTCT